MAYPDWKAPAEDGQILIWPEPRDLLEQTRLNHAQLSTSQAPIQNIPLAELRRRQRQWLGHQDDAQVIIASGHQTELYHSGVWVKDVLANAAASALGGAAYHFAVDTDQPKHLNLKWPAAESAHGAYSAPISDDPHLATANWAALLNAPTPAHIAEISEALAERRFSFQPMLGDFLLGLRRLSLESPNLASALTNATHALSWSLGQRHHALLCSPLFSSEPYLAFVHHILANALRFASDYNSALADYRRQKRLRSPMRPMPDLHITPTSCEVPFWLDDLATGTRQRAQIWRDGDELSLVTPGGEELVLDAKLDGWEAAARLLALLRRGNVRLSPRALTLTLFLRLLVVDLFIHGIGGARYDQVTDQLIGSHFGIAPPRFAVTTATLYFPDAISRDRACLPCVRSQGHRLRHSILGDRKRELVSAIESAPRYSIERRQRFAVLHQELSRAAVNNPALEQWQAHLRQTEARVAEEATLFDRELFFALQPRQRLEQMIERYTRAIG